MSYQRPVAALLLLGLVSCGLVVTFSPKRHVASAISTRTTLRARPLAGRPNVLSSPSNRLPTRHQVSSPVASKKNLQAIANRGLAHHVARASIEPETSSPTGGGKNLVVIPEDYRLGGTLLGVAFLLGPVLHLWWPQFFLHGLLGGFLTFQTTRVRFRFSDDDLDVVFVEAGEDAEIADTSSSGDNKLQGGGVNKWSLKSVTNWEMWWPGFPVLVYYKENQTKPGGQPHFFPIIMDGKKLYEQMLLKMGPSANAKPPLEDWNLDTALEATPIGRSIKEQLDADQIAKLKGIKDAKDILKLFN